LFINSSIIEIVCLYSEYLNMNTPFIFAGEIKIMFKQKLYGLKWY